MAEQLGAKVLIVDDDDDIARLVEEVLSEEGYAVTVLRGSQIDAIQEAVSRIQPDCLLLDGGGRGGYEESWDSAASIAARSPAVPVIMFTAHVDAVAEARENTSERSQAAGFTAWLDKPFALTELLRVVEQAAARSRKPVLA